MIASADERPRVACGRVEGGRAPARSVLWINHFAVAPGDGGGTRHYEIGRELARLGWGVTIAASDYHYLSRRYLRRGGADDLRVVHEPLDGLEFQWFWSAPYEGNDWRRGWNWLSFSRSVLRWTPRVGPPDLVIGSSPHLFGAMAGARLARRWGVPFVLEVRDLWPESIVAAGGRKGPAYHILGAIARYLYRRADLILCLARGTQAHLERTGVDPARLLFVPNGVDPEAFASVSRPPRDTFTLVYAGAHGPANGLDAVLDAAELLRGSPEIRFLLVGDGPAKPGLVASAGARGLGAVEFRDPVPKLRVPDLLAEADAGLMVLRDSPLFAFGVSPNKLFDYFGAALPVVCNVPGEVAGIVEAAAAGTQARDASGQALADAILRLYRRPAAERVRMGLGAREWVGREHAREVM
ncbi:MAG: glycosyltransferase family 4 protein, partial [Gemmatimonadetes bacterium]|nr:glycosyltransferase family 4 protein [Gemmatimonadota bacterium]